MRDQPRFMQITETSIALTGNSTSEYFYSVGTDDFFRPKYTENFYIPGKTNRYLRGIRNYLLEIYRRANTIRDFNSIYEHERCFEYLRVGSILFCFITYSSTFSFFLFSFINVASLPKMLNFLFLRKRTIVNIDYIIVYL